MQPNFDIETAIQEIELHGMRTWLIQAFTRAFREARKHKLKTFNEQSYEERWLRNIPRLVDAVLERYYFVKLDIRGYFMSLPREQLYARVKWGLDRQFAPYLHISEAYELYKICCYLWRQTLLDDPVSHSRRRGPLKYWQILPQEKSLYRQPYGQGIVIGNLTSQLVSNIYLDSLDRFVKFDLGYHFYGRYVDDFYFLVHAKDYKKAKQDVKRIEEFLKSELLLTLHPKKRYYGKVEQGISFLGYRIYPHCFYPSNRVQQKLKTSLHNFKYADTKPDSLISYLGLMKHMDADKFVKQLFDKNDIDFDLYREFNSDTRRSMQEILADMKKRRQ